MMLVTRHSIVEDRPTLRILLAEDNPVNQEVAAAMLRKRGHQVQIVNNGVEAVEAVKGSATDVVLMDLQMPEMDGLQATAEIREYLAGRPLPIIAVTANVLAGERERCLAAGMDDYLTKPFKPHQLFSIVEGWGKKEAPSEEAELPAAQETEPVAQVAAPAEEAAPVDISGLREELRAAGVEEIVEELLRTFLQDAPNRLKALEDAVGAADARGIERAAHAYKSSAGTVRAHDLAGLLKEAELAASSGDMAETRKLLSRVVDAHHRALKYLAAANGGPSAN
jgi:CheY-like chemotaxis protein